MLSEFDRRVLTILAELGLDPVSVKRIIDRVEAETGRTVSFGAVYTAIERLQREDLVATTFEDGGKERGYRNRMLVQAVRRGAGR